MDDLIHPTFRTVWQYKHPGVSISLEEGNWIECQWEEVLQRGPHKRSCDHTPFLQVEFYSMVEKWQGVVPPYHLERQLPGLSLSPPG